MVKCLLRISRRCVSTYESNCILACTQSKISRKSALRWFYIRKLFVHWILRNFRNPFCFAYGSNRTIPTKIPQKTKKIGKFLRSWIRWKTLNNLDTANQFSQKLALCIVKAHHFFVEYLSSGIFLSVFSPGSTPGLNSYMCIYHIYIYVCI